MGHVRPHYLEPKTGIVIPMQAVNRVGGQSFVYVVEEDKSKTAICGIKTCEIGDVQNDRYPVLEGIKVGDQVVPTFSNCAMGHSSNSNLRKAGESIRAYINQVHLRGLMLFTLNLRR